MKPDLRQLIAAPKQDKPKLFLNYCRKVIKAKRRGDIPLDDAGYQIAETMFIYELDEPLFDELTGLAGELELPKHILKKDPEDEWKRLIELVDEYEMRLKQGGEPEAFL